MQKTIDYLVLDNGTAPFLSWVSKLQVREQIIVDRLIMRVSAGGARKSTKQLKDGVCEIRIPYGAGLRVYFGFLDGDKMLLLLGGDKKTQKWDIEKAKHYWREYGQSK